MSDLGRIGVCLAVLGLGACGQPNGTTPADATAATGIRFLADGDIEGFSRAIESRAFVFPDDHGAHPDYRTEWWYFVGNLFADGGRHFGFELTFFRLALTPLPTQRESAWSANQIWLAHFAVTDTAGTRFFAEERSSRGALGLSGAVVRPLRIWVEDWFVEGDLAAPSGTLRLSAQGEMTGIGLELRGFDRIVPQGEEGLDRKGPEPGNASYYYSAPRLSARGSIRVGDQMHGVAGFAWMDREWGTRALSSGVVGWDWFALQLDDGRDLMFYRLRRDDGSTSAFSGGVLIDAAGRSRRLEAADVGLEIVEHWRSRSSGVSYPVSWNMRVPSEGLELRIRPRLRDQELRLSARYWEGAVDVQGRSGSTRIGGVGYLELAGY
jgi:predicted secreted hydrolase